MTIKEMEVRSDMTRANIRFYEAQGLLAPARSANGYRDYCENDLEILKRIKLLRTLHIPLDDIRAMHTGERALLEVLGEHIAKLGQDQAELAQSQAVCQSMRSDGVHYETLDAQRYLLTMAPPDQRTPPELVADAIPKVRAPIRRYLARTLDGFIYTMLWYTILALVFRVNVLNFTQAEQFLHNLFGILLMVFIEPALLALFGSTAGKWVLGLHVTHIDGQKLTYPQALARIGNVLLWGEGLHIPIYSWVRLWRSYKACDMGETLDWEQESTMILKDEKSWRVGAFLGAFVIAVGLFFLSNTALSMPRNRGEITVAEFCENYNQLTDYYGIEPISILDKNGDWVERQEVRGSVIIDIFEMDGTIITPQFTFKEENGVMTGVTITAAAQDSTAWIFPQTNTMSLASLAFVRAQKGCGPFSGAVNDLIDQIADFPFEDFERTLHGVTVSCDYDFSGYEEPAHFGVLVPNWDGDASKTDYSFSFTMEK